MTLRLSSFGIRGFVGSSLTPRVVMDYAAAFGTHLRGGRVLLGRDTRYSSPMLHSAVTASLMSCGCEVLDFGICPTPILQYSVKPYEAAGAVSISGGHNGMGWNAITLIGSDGAVLEPVGGEPVLDYFHSGDFLKRDYRSIGPIHRVDDFAMPYLEAIRNHLDMNVMSQFRRLVLIDPVGGAGCRFLNAFTNLIGVSLVPINAEASGYLAREPEPRPRSARQMASFIRHIRGDIGFILSSDMGRLSIVTETGEPASEEYTFAIMANHVLSKRRGTVVTNCCSTKTIDDLAARYGAPVVKTPVGQAYVASALADEQGVVGGEGSGSAALPAFCCSFDGFLMMGIILEAMAKNNCKVSDLLRALPRYDIVKRSIPCGSRKGYHALAMLKAKYSALPDAKIDLTDGMRIDWEDGWLHVRASRTEQLIRVISESSKKQIAERRADEAERLIEQEI